MLQYYDLKTVKNYTCTPELNMQHDATVKHTKTIL